jgi:hypothetical protein
MRDANIPMWKDPDLVLDYRNFWSQTHLFCPYVVPRVSDDSIAQYELGLSSCIERIEGNRPRHVAEQIISNNKVCSIFSKLEKHYITFKLLFFVSNLIGNN